MREAVEKNPNMSEKEARDLIDKCMKILHYRDGRSFNRVSKNNRCYSNYRKMLQISGGRQEHDLVYEYQYETL